MNKIVFLLLTTALVTTLGIYLFLNLGNFMDVTKEPKKADIIVALGGGTSEYRLKKAISLYKQGMSKSKIFIYTGKDTTNNSFQGFNSKKQYILSQEIKNENIFHINKSMITNTMEELFFIKKYMLYNNYKSVIFVSDSEHSRRIETLANIIADYEENGLEFSIVSCNPTNWDKNSYYTNKLSLVATMREAMKLVYNLIKYNSLGIVHTDYYEHSKDIKWDKILKKID